MGVVTDYTISLMKILGLCPCSILKDYIYIRTRLFDLLAK